MFHILKSVEPFDLWPLSSEGLIFVTQSNVPFLG